MTLVELLRLQADEAFRELLQTAEGVSQPLAWAPAPVLDSEYLHTNANILGIVQHVASCKVMYGSAAFRCTELRWRDCAKRLDQIGNSWSASVDWLRETQAYWLQTWTDLADEELIQPRPTNWGEMWPTWRIIHEMTHHDSYHAGQIILLRATLSPGDAPPPSTAEDIRCYCSDSPSW